MATSYVSLHNHTHYSLLDALTSPKDLFVAAKAQGQKSVAITDHGTLGSAYEALQVSRQIGVKLIIGCETYFVDSVANKDVKFRHLILLAKNQTGYRNLLALNKTGYDNNATFHKRVYPLIDWDMLNTYHEGLIALTSCSNGILGSLIMQKRNEEVEEQLQRLIAIFGDDLGLEVQPNTLKRGSALHNDNIEQTFVNHQLVKLGKKFGVRVVATTNSHYVSKDDYESHDVELAIGSHQPVRSNFRLKYNCSEFYIKSGDEVKKFFERNYGEAQAAEFVANSLYFADKCEAPDWIDPKFSNSSGKELPLFPCKDEADYQSFLVWQKTRAKKITERIEDEQFLRFRCEASFFDKVPKDKITEYRDRLETELDVFYYCGAASYMLIVADYVEWARQNAIAVGPGRGSVGGSLVGWLLKIHQADPIKYGLVFERFYSKKRTSLADCDCDFSQSGRERVLAYIIDKYGQENVAQISNFVTMTPKVYVRDISRACELAETRTESVELGNSIAECIPAEVKTIDSAFDKVPLFAEYCKRYPQLMKFKQIASKPRQTSLHAAGIIISHRPLHTIVPMRRDKDGIYVIEYDKDVSEANGLVKMDILGLTTLDIIETTNTLIRGAGKEVPTIDYETYDEKTYDLISRGDTFGVFQFGISAGTVDLCKKIKPKSIEDLALINTLARPAARAIRASFIKARNGQSKVNLLHPSLQNAFKNTLGYPLYDESLLVLAKDVAGWDLDEADKLRKLTKEKGKSPEKVRKWKEEFIEGAVKNGLSEIIATRIWDEICVPFGGYSFNKSLYKHTGIPVYTQNGQFIADKPIKDIQIGEYVRSRDEKTGNDIFVRVNGKYDHGILPLVEVKLTTGEVIKCTTNHKFRVRETGEMLPLWKIIEDGLSIVVEYAHENQSSIQHHTAMSNIASITQAGSGQTYDLGIDHSDHQFYLSNGALTSNSHSVLYSMIAYHTAYLKSHFPIEFLLANLMDEIRSNSPKAAANIQKIKSEIRAHRVKIVQPNINISELRYTMKKADLITGLDAIKFVSDDAISDIISKRPFTSFQDFMTRIDSRKVRANAIQALAAGGCLDCFGIERHLMFLYCSDYRKKITVWLKRHDPSEEFKYEWPKEKGWTVPQTYAMEYKYLGEGFACSPASAYGGFFVGPSISIAEIRKMADKTTIPSFKCIVKDLFEFRVKKETSRYYGKAMMKVLGEDETGQQCGITIFPDRLEQVMKRLDIVKIKKFEIGIALHFSGTANIYEDELGIILNQVYNIAPIPPTPNKAELKPKKISMRMIRKEKEIIPDDPIGTFEDIEDEMVVEGFIEPEDPEIDFD